MRASFLLVVLLSLKALSVAQSQLAPNPNCPDTNAPYCRGVVTPLPNSPTDPNGPIPFVIGVQNGVLYATAQVTAGQMCPKDSAQTTAEQTTCFYSANRFMPENWTYVGQTGLIPPPQFAIEGAFPSSSGSCSGYKYLYTNGQQILRATSDPSDWSFTDISGNLPNVPSDTAAKVGDFATTTLASGQTRLFYGNYNNHTIDPPHAYLWYSDTCGDTWTQYEFTVTIQGTTYHGREIHTIAVDPANPNNVYVNVDTECDQNGNYCPGDQTLGLWQSTGGGLPNTFGLVASGRASTPQDTVGINVVIPNVGDSIFMEADNGGAGTGPCAGSPPCTGPLLSWTPGNGDVNQVAAFWPSVAPYEPAWDTSAIGACCIGLTSEQNIFLVSNPDDANPATQEAAWYFLPPSFSTPILLEDFTPAISTVSGSGGLATVVTFEPHGIQPSDSLTISGVTPPGFNTAQGATVTPTVVDAYTFTYPCPNCPASGTGGFAMKQGLTFGGYQRTMDATDASTGISYIFSGRSRIVKPQSSALLTTIVAVVNNLLLD